MKWVKNKDFYQLRLSRNEEIIGTLIEFVKKKRIKSGLILGLGAGSKFVLGYYDLNHRVYRRRQFRGEYEICSLVGNIAWENDEPICHIHILISNQRFLTFGGHLFSGKTAATCEIVILPGAKKLTRRLESATGLKLLQL